MKSHDKSQQDNTGGRSASWRTKAEMTMTAIVEEAVREYDVKPISGRKYDADVCGTEGAIPKHGRSIRKRLRLGNARWLMGWRISRMSKGRVAPPPVRGEVWIVELDPIVGHEQGGVRPTLVVSADRVQPKSGRFSDRRTHHDDRSQPGPPIPGRSTRRRADKTELYHDRPAPRHLETATWTPPW